MNTGILILLLVNNSESAVAIANASNVCPEGKEGLPPEESFSMVS